MKQIVEVEVEIPINTPKGQIAYSSITLLFSKKPTNQQLIEATRNYLTENYGDYSNDTALQFMGVVKKLNVPNTDDINTNDDGIIYSNKRIFFEIVED